MSLAAAQTYNFALRALNSAGPGEATDSQAVTVVGKPGEVMGFTATPQNGQVWLTWNPANNDSITGWDYWQRTGRAMDQIWSSIAGSGAGTTAHLVTGLTNGQQYRFRSRSVNVAGQSEQTDNKNATPTADEANIPLQPRGLAATPDAGEVTLTWADPNDSSITKYQYTQDGGTTWEDISESSATTTSYTVTGLTNGTQYTFQVRAVNNAGGVSASDRVIITPGRLTVWSATISTKELAEGGDVVVKAWSSVGNRYSGASLTCGRDTCNTLSYGGETYTIAELRNSIESKIHLIAFAAGTVLPKTLNEFEFHIGSGISYRWGDGKKSTESVPVAGTRVLKFDCTGAVYDLPEGADARWPTDKPVDISITAPRPIPAAPTGLSAASSNGEAALRWNDPDDSTISSYQYQQSSSQGPVGNAVWGEWTDIPNSAPDEANATSYSVTRLTNGTEYTFQIRAVNSAGESAASDSVMVTPTSDITGDITGVTLTSAPVSVLTRDGVLTGAYGQNEQVTVRVAVRNEVTVTETPTLTLDVGALPRQAGYVSEDSTATKLAFVYTVVAADEDEDGIAIAANSISLNGGSIRTSGGEDIDLSHAEVAASVAHRVSNVFTWSISADQTEIREGETVTVTVTLSGERNFTTESGSASIQVVRGAVTGKDVTASDWEAAVESQSLNYDDFRNDGYSTTLTFTIGAAEDGVSEADETFEIPFELPDSVAGPPYGEQALTLPADGTTVLVLVLNTDASAAPPALRRPQATAKRR